MQGNFLKEKDFTVNVKRLLRNQTAKKGIIMNRDATKIINVKIRDSK